MKVKFTFLKKDQTEINLVYLPFDNDHSRLWVQGISNFIKSKIKLTDNERVYNFNDYNEELKTLLENCNSTIVKLNRKYKISMPPITLDNLQDDINYVHTFFAELERENHIDNLWTRLNEYLHGLEIIERGKNKKLQGQVFCGLPNYEKYDIPEKSYSYFTIKKKFGYCYANYPHVGRHILEMYNARDEDAHDDHVLPMHKIAGDFYLWFGNDSSLILDTKKIWDIKRWFHKNNIDKIVNMKWGDPRLAIGWLPVAEIEQQIDKKDLIGLCKIKKIDLIE